ncbi:glucose-6-phosphate isomerase [Orrella daihaiensis]|uniref:Glucose-6-phosphate isomerase n=1 Tax=Orrella daihaiensis TaxID=2782176 RepID=A0ABY4AKG0_9BURK|nr:glucose-6-phosphate isomerase [Orrella daihaiensis]UOD50774.1 glucose-6-phosphate isomerase [Orrella daihaiensis]
MALQSNPAWQAFSDAVQAAHADPEQLRLIEAGQLTVDLSAQRDSQTLRDAAIELLSVAGFEQARHALFEGGIANLSENRPALHTALRSSHAPESVRSLITAQLERMKRFVDDANTYNRYSNVVHLGIGGSDWGPRMVWHSLKGVSNRRTLRFAANIDAHAITAALDGLDPRDTLIIVASKSFTTTETMTNAREAIKWLEHGGIKHPLNQVVALTANPAAAIEFGVAPERIFEFWDWVGGRYSIWSTIGLPVALGLGWTTFEELLQGARDMDTHFQTAAIAHNAPVQLALNMVANTSILGFSSEVICPYDARLTDFVPWLQQLQMESLGKAVDQQGNPIDVSVSPAVWGMPGTDSQHTFFQWLHQSQRGAPVDFIFCIEPEHHLLSHHRQLVANCLAQRAALWRGKSVEVSFQELKHKHDESHAQWLAQHCLHPGGRPSTLIVLPKLDAHRLGALLALYEHKVFVAGVLWGLNPFDQWGVEFGKRLALELMQNDPEQTKDFDASTRHWLASLMRVTSKNH